MKHLAFRKSDKCPQKKQQKTSGILKNKYSVFLLIVAIFSHEKKFDQGSFWSCVW